MKVNYWCIPGIIGNEGKIMKIKRIVCDYFELSLEDIVKKCRKREIVKARQIAMYFAKKMTGFTLAKIGKEIGRKNYATVIHSHNTVKDLMDTDKNYNGNVSEIELKIKQEYKKHIRAIELLLINER